MLLTERASALGCVAMQYAWLGSMASGNHGLKLTDPSSQGKVSLWKRIDYMTLHKKGPERWWTLWERSLEIHGLAW